MNRYPSGDEPIPSKVQPTALLKYRSMLPVSRWQIANQSILKSATLLVEGIALLGISFDR